LFAPKGMAFKGGMVRLILNRGQRLST